MSGVTLAMAPRSEPDQTTTSASQDPAQTKCVHRPPPPQQQSVGGGIMGSLRVIELQLVVFVMVFSVSGLVPLLDLLFPAFATAYLLALARLAFPSHSNVSSSSSQEIFQGSKLFRMYVIVGTTIGLFLPLAYVLGGFARGDEQAVRSAAPHLFLLSFQILTENVISGLSLFSQPVRALVPLLYTVRRTFVIIDWNSDVWLNKNLPENAQFKDVSWFWFGRSLASANLLYISINLFGFLIPRFLPRSFERYFREKVETHAKMAEDKHSSTAGIKPIPAEKKAD